MKKTQIIDRKELEALYLKPLPSSRSGALFGAFSYPTKISPEVIALFIASHTQPGDIVLDPFAGSGTTGLATILCSNPTEDLKNIAEKLNLPVKWGKRKAVLYELSTMGAFIAQSLCYPPEPKRFIKLANEWITSCEKRLGGLYNAVDDQGNVGKIRHSIWSEVLFCPFCKAEISFWDCGVTLSPVTIANECTCPICKNSFNPDIAVRSTEEAWDPVLGANVSQRKRKITYIYGETKGKNWVRLATPDDDSIYSSSFDFELPKSIPNWKIGWGDLHRTGYHYGISHIHHFYTRRNLLITGALWEGIASFPDDIQPFLKLLALSYNSSHSTLMTRVVVKKGVKDFVVTGAQSGVLYISGLPVEKNIFKGLRRKIKTFAEAFEITYGNNNMVDIINSSSTTINLPDNCIDYVFTDPPFGDFIPYSEVNLINEVWLGKTTDNNKEIIISPTQKKSVDNYGNLMTLVFSEIYRVTKDEAKATIVFHSAKRQVWEALQKAYVKAGFTVELSSVLDKQQGSFKQINSMTSVKGDPLLLLTKEGHAGQKFSDSQNFEEILDTLIDAARKYGDPKELSVERLYSRYIGYLLGRGSSVLLDASQFYPLAKNRLELL